MGNIAKIAVEQTAYHFDKPFDYGVPKAMQHKLQRGSRVLVPFGAGNRTKKGIVVDFAEQSEYTNIKNIAAVLDVTSLLSDEMIDLGRWMGKYTFCPIYDALKALLPTGLDMKRIKRYRIKDDWDAELSEQEKTVVETLSAHKNGLEQAQLLRRCKLTDNTVPESLVDKNVLMSSEDAVRKLGDLTVKMARLLIEQQDVEEKNIKLTDKQSEVVSLLMEIESCAVKEICYFTGVTPAVVNGLAKRGVIELFTQQRLRDPYEAAARPGRQTPIALTDEQSAVFNGLYEQYRQQTGSAALLYGVTGSGKSSVYMRLIDEVRKSGKSVIVMVPEISLTPQTLRLFHERYGQQVAVFHSGLSLGERMDEWKRVKNGQANIVVGTRSAVFAPLQNIGLIVMDEEQEHTYKSENAPRYHARDVARYRCAKHNALLLLCSATPSVESFYAAQSGRYGFFKLNKRYGEATLPQVLVADMNKELLAGNTTALSGMLIDEMQTNLERGEQSIILLNRRGYETFASCPGCRHIMTCPQCSISLTYHNANRRLMCHYCGYSEPRQELCPNCKQKPLRFGGKGTQKAEEQIGQFFEQARILRMDTDTTMTRFSYEKKLQAFADKEYDIMIGTQMVAKGLDFSNVTLVGILNADQSLYNGDYRSYEKTFSLLTQVVGRSGRGKQKGRAVIQTLTPDNTIIQLASRQDYEAFYESEIITRQAMLYPPFSDVTVIGFSSLDSAVTQKGAQHFFELLTQSAKEQTQNIPMRVLGPAPAAVPKVSGRYRYRLIIKSRYNAAFRAFITSVMSGFSKEYDYKSVTVFIDYNPDTIH